MSPSAFAGSPRCSPSPARAVSQPRTRSSSRARNAYWIDGWRRATAATLADQVRFEREWQRAARVRRRARHPHLRRHADLRRRATAPTIARTRSSSSTTRSPACRPTPSPKTGQLWGNPLYDWPAMRADGYRWWIERFRRAFELVDLTRLDHFRGFVSYWAVPAAQRDRGRTGTGGAAPARVSSTRCGRELGAAAARRGGPRRDHGGGRAPAQATRAARHGRAAVRVRRRSREPAPAREPRGAVGRLHRHARQRHDARLVRSR